MYRLPFVLVPLFWAFSQPHDQELVIQNAASDMDCIMKSDHDREGGRDGTGLSFFGGNPAFLIKPRPTQGTAGGPGRNEAGSLPLPPILPLSYSDNTLGKHAWLSMHFFLRNHFLKV